MALTVGDRAIHPLTADDVMRMVEAGILGEDDRVELLGGVLTEVSPKSPEHGTVTARLVRWLVANDPEGRFEVRTEHPLVVPDRRSLPEPDVAVVERNVPGEHPTTALLVIEVAVTSLRTDTEVKPALYAAAGVPEYWVIDVPGRRLIRFRGPTAAGYAKRDEVLPGTSRIAPSQVPAGAVDLTAILAGL